ncbi:MAG: glycosyltransferase family 2 protein [Myxococcota bacterium]
MQTWRELELVVVDDASTDRTPDLVAAFRDSRVRLVRLERNVGVGAASNVALAQARGELVARLDADDYALSHRLERQVAAMRADPSIAVLGSGYFEVDVGRRAPARVHRPFTGAGLHTRCTSPARSTTPRPCSGARPCRRTAIARGGAARISLCGSSSSRRASASRTCASRWSSIGATRRRSPAAGRRAAPSCARPSCGTCSASTCRSRRSRPGTAARVRCRARASWRPSLAR